MSNYSLPSENVAMEPNEHFHDVLKEEKLKQGMCFPMKIIDLKRQNVELPSTDSEFDVVIYEHMLCSADAPNLVLNNVDVALKPGGRFTWPEQVTVGYQSFPTFSCSQRVFSPILFVIGNGCKFRSTGEIITYHFEQCDGRHDLDCTHFDAPVSFFMKFIAPHVMGIAAKNIQIKFLLKLFQIVQKMQSLFISRTRKHHPTIFKVFRHSLS